MSPLHIAHCTLFYIHQYAELLFFQNLLFVFVVTLKKSLILTVILCAFLHFFPVRFYFQKSICIKEFVWFFVLVTVCPSCCCYICIVYFVILIRMPWICVLSKECDWISLFNLHERKHTHIQSYKVDVFRLIVRNSKLN